MRGAIRTVLLGAALAGAAVEAAAGQDAPRPTAAPGPARADTGSVGTDPRPAAIRPEDQRKDAPWKPFSEVTKGAKVLRGAFTVYRKRDNVLLGVAPAQLDRDYLLVTQLSQGIGEAGLDGGRTVRSDLVRFHRAGDRIELWVVNTQVAAEAGSPAARAVAYSFGHSVAYSFPIAAVRDTAEIVVNLTPFLTSDWADLAAALQGVAAARKVPAGVTLDRDRSSVTELRVFPTNLEADARLTYAVNRDLGLETVPDHRSVPLGVHYSLVELPAEPMRPRYADDRVGYFVSAVKDFSRDTADGFFVRYVNRWRLEKSDPAAPVSAPVRPIVFYLDRTVPLEWRPYVRAGILEWNRAFEAAGFRDALVVLDAPDDSLWSAEDARHSTVRWTATNRSVYAIGPTSVDPRTGEILNADVLIAASWIPAWRGEQREYVGPQTAVRAAFLDDSLLGAGAGARLCRYGAGLAWGGTLARAVLAGAGRADGGDLPREFIGQALKALVMHEIGHTLGLRHNFRGSAGAAGNGLGVSVMDYHPPALNAAGGPQGDFYPPTVGSYDRWAIAYGYAPVAGAAGRPVPGGDPGAEAWRPDGELPALRALAAESADPAHLYASDEDAGFGAAGLDPTVSRYDQTDDPLAWARGRVGMINGLFDSLETRLVRPGEEYGRLRAAFADLLTDRWYAMLVTTKYLGGAATSRDHRGDPGARPAVATVPLARQREALDFILEAGFGEGAYRFRPELLSRLAPDRWLHWGGSPAAPRADFPLHDWAATQQVALLDRMLDPVTLARIRDAELRAPEGEPTLGLPELFERLAVELWAEAGVTAKGPPKEGEAARRAGAAKPRTPRNTTSIRRDVQRAHLNSLVRLVVSPPAGTPEDARSLARATLADLAAQLDRALDRSGELDAYTRAHLADSRERIAQALTASMVQAAPR